MVSSNTEARRGTHIANMNRGESRIDGCFEMNACMIMQYIMPPPQECGPYTNGLGFRGFIWDFTGFRGLGFRV